MQNSYVAGIVAEYNPFHAGHAWMIERLKTGGFTEVVCVLSGPFVQRAEPACLPTWVRAAAAIAGGADLVLRLPAPWAAASAERFAAGGAGLLAALGVVDALAFGAECGEVDRLSELAFLLTSEAFREKLPAQLAKGQSFAAARAAALDAVSPGAGDVLRQPNNILAVEYCKALQSAVPEALAASGHPYPPGYLLPVPLALPRVGARHDGAPADGFASASWLRGLARREGAGALQPWVPAACLPLYRKAEAGGETADPARFETAALSRLRGKTAADFAHSPGAGEGLEARLAAAASRAVTLEELYAFAKSKRFAHSRVRRLALSAVLGLPKQASALPPFAQVLAASPAGLRLLRRAKQAAFVPVGTSLAKLAKASAAAAEVAALEAAAEDLYALCETQPRPGGLAYTQPAVFAL